ncbi:hypothetical protein Cob_v012202 [Colletotrichum orbiculare MAFF 240422]|uniref:Rhodopsin domain-containing protein n=1 Tax=Colletotrichum orbiculare (strain 104-T / ATCC 96160 / CBS 514.97 / LARS 414 / MAFF 240422) TaxID=1213857 RepID=A0A484F9F5_COLOR|nr:hypothetical protein Cob_v012202 [Colletotrichum orbiculare MAFF 240422]
MVASPSSDLARPTGAPFGGDGPPAQTDFVYDVGMARATVAFGAIVTIITTGSIVARLYSRYFVTKHVRIDHAWAVGALLSTICVFIMQAIFAMVYLPEATSMIIAADKGSRIPYATNITYNIAMALLKMTFLFQFYHIFRQVRVMRMVYVIAIGVVSAWSLAQILLTILVCIPVEANWNTNIQGKCLPSVISTYGQFWVSLELAQSFPSSQQAVYRA